MLHASITNKIELVISEMTHLIFFVVFCSFDLEVDYHYRFLDIYFIHKCLMCLFILVRKVVLKMLCISETKCDSKYDISTVQGIFLRICFCWHIW